MLMVVTAAGITSPMRLKDVKNMGCVMWMLTFDVYVEPVRIAMISSMPSMMMPPPMHVCDYGQGRINEELFVTDWPDYV